MRVWDLPTRLFHWLLAGLVLATALIGWVGPKWMLGMHAVLGYAIAALIALRLVWGVFGPETSRFASFPVRPRAALAYLKDLVRGRPPHHVGHNPAGAMMIYALLATIAAVLLSGLVAFGGVEKHGPLAGVVSYAVGRAFEDLHAGLATVLFTLVGLHVAGVAVGSLVERQNLARAMVTGFKRLPGDAPLPRLKSARPWLAALSVAAFLAVAGGVLSALAALPPRGVPDMPRHATYAKECGDCHMAFPPQMLPRRSWVALMNGLDNHFGEKATLPAATRQAIVDYLAGNAGDVTRTREGGKFMTSIPGDRNPLRITETGRFLKKHNAREVPPDAWQRKSIGSKANCPACHLQAEQGDYDERAVRIPR